MPILINDHELTDAEVEAELPHHQEADNPLKQATTAVAIRHILLDEALRLGLSGVNDEAIIDALLATEVTLPEVDEATCRRYYDQHKARFVVGELVEVDHILFQVTPNVPLDGLRALAEYTLAELMADPQRFAERARELSNCPSSEVGGNLGQIGRGDTVPEFERVVFAMQPGEVLPRLLETRFGLHIVRVNRRVEGRLMPYERVASHVADALRTVNRDTAWRQYVQLLVGRARVKGVMLEGADTPLLQ